MSTLRSTTICLQILDAKFLGQYINEMIIFFEKWNQIIRPQKNQMILTEQPTPKKF